MIEAAREPFTRAIEASDARRFAWLYASEPARAVLELFFALDHELQTIVQPSLDHSVAHARLGWWQEEAERTASGKAVHPLTIAITRRCHAAELPVVDLRALVATLAWDLAGAPCPTEAELRTYTSAWARSWFATLSELLAPRTTQMTAISLQLGSGLRELQLLALWQRDPQLAGLRIPADALARIGLNAESAAVHPMRALLYDLLAERHTHARRNLAAAIEQLPPEMHVVWAPLLVWAYCEYHDSHAAVAQLPKGRRSIPLTRIGRTFGAWRAALRARAGEFSLPSR